MSTKRCSAKRRAAAEAELHVDEAAVEAGIVRDQRAVADELGELLDDLLEARLPAQELVGQPVHRDRLVGDRRGAD